MNTSKALPPLPPYDDYFILGDDARRAGKKKVFATLKTSPALVRRLEVDLRVTIVPARSFDERAHNVG